MTNPFEWILRKLGLIKETRQLTYLCHAFQYTKEVFDSAKNAPAVMTRKRDDSPSKEMRSMQSASFDDRVFALDFNMILMGEMILNADMKNVRIHTGPEADSKTRMAGADALTSGDDIYFREGMFDPQTEEGKNLLIHELQHVVQHQKGKNPNFIEDRETLEYEASKKEAAIAGRELQSVERSELGDAEGSGEHENQVGMTEASSDLQDFGRKKTEYIRVIDRAGKKYLITRDEREEVVRNATEKVQEKLASEWDYMDEERKERIVDNLYFRRGGSL